MVPLLGKLIPFNEAGLTTLPLDPDRMLTRSFVADEQQPKISASYGTVGPRAVGYTCVTPGELKDRLMTQAGVDRCAFTNDSELLRAQDEAAASALMPKLVQSSSDEFIDHDVAPPDGVPNAKCYEQKQAIWSDSADARFECGVTFGRYVAFVHSNEEKDARQRAAAQYAILVNSA
jgi:hypothetical protein